MDLLITGGLGYIGSNTINQILKNNLNFNIIILDNTSNSNIEIYNKLCNLYPTKNITLYKNDLQDLKILNEIFTKFNIYAVIHFAGFKSVSESINNPLLYYSNNVSATIQLLQVMEKYDVKNFIFSSSATVYGNQKSPLNENCITGQNLTNPYGKSKYLVEEILKDLKHFNIWCLRYFNPIGSDENRIFIDNPSGIPNNLFPYIVRVAKKELPHLNVFGNTYNTPDGSCLRDFIHVVDLAEAHISALLNFKNGFNYVNVGTGKGTSVLELINIFEKVNNIKIPYIIQNKRDGDIDIVYCDNLKIKNELNWTPIHNLENACILK